MIITKDNRENFDSYRSSDYFHITHCWINESSDYHIHNFPQILYSFEGSFAHRIDDADYIQREGDLILLPPYFSHALDASTEPVHWIFVNFADNFLNMFPEGEEKKELFNLVCLRPLTYKLRGANPFIHFEGESRVKLENILNDMSKEFLKHENKSPSYLRAKLVQLLTVIAEQSTAVCPEADRTVYANYRSSLQRAMDYIDRHYCEHLNRDEICRIAHMSRSSFTYIFKQIVGQTLLEYITSLRIRRAMQLLSEGELSIIDIGEQCGFDSAPYFSHTFKDHTGFTPREYAKLIKKSD